MDGQARGFVGRPRGGQDNPKGLSCYKPNPPYPPLSGGYKKATPPRQVQGLCFCPFAGGTFFRLPGGGGFAFSYPLTRGGRGGCFSRRGGLCQQPHIRPLHGIFQNSLDSVEPSFINRVRPPALVGIPSRDNRISSVGTGLCACPVAPPGEGQPRRAGQPRGGVVPTVSIQGDVQGPPAIRLPASSRISAAGRLP